MMEMGMSYRPTFMEVWTVDATTTDTKMRAVLANATTAMANGTAVATAVAVDSSANPAMAGQPVSFTATVSPAAPGTATPTGMVQFEVDGNRLGSPVAVAGGVAVSPSISSLAVGSHGVTATFTDATLTFLASTGVLNGQIVAAHTSTALAASPASVVYGQSATLTATVSNLDTADAITGTVRFYDGAQLLGHATVGPGGVAALTTSALTGGAHSLTASYVGTATLAASTSAAVGLAVSPARTAATLGTSSATAICGQPVTLTASVANLDTAPVPDGGKVTFYLDYGTTAAKVLGTATLSGGAATLTTGPNAFSAGQHTVTAVYGGTANLQGSTSGAVAEAVSQAPTAVALGSSPAGTVTYGQSVTFTIVVTDPDTGLVPTGKVQIFDGSTRLATVTLDSLGQASWTTGALSRGSHMITAVYQGTANFQPSTSDAVALSVV